MQKTAVLRKFLGFALIKMVIGVAVVIQAAILITAAFIYTRSLWFSIFFTSHGTSQNPVFTEVSIPGFLET